MRIDNDTLRLVMAAVLGPIFWAGVHYVTKPLLDRLAAKGASARRRRREQQADRAKGLGRKLGGWVRRHWLPR